MSNRIGHFNPSLQGPNEPSASLERQLEEYTDELGFIKDDMQQLLISNYNDESEIIRLTERIKSRKEQIEGLKGRFEETGEFVKDLEDYVGSLLNRKDQIKLELELLREDPGNEKEIEALQNEYLEINNRL